VSDDAPVIGISAGRIPVGERVVDGTQRDYADRIVDAGGIPVILPVMPLGAQHRVVSLLDGLLLTGGGDVAPDRYGALPAPESGGIDPERDEAESALIEDAWRRGLPVLAVCRGIQILNVARGGSLVQHLPVVTDEPHLVIERRTEPVHTVRLGAGSLLREIVGADRLETNSLHHQAIAQVGRQLTAVGWAADGTIEAVEDRDRNIVAVQWHPEQLPDRPEQRSLFSWLVDRASALCRPAVDQVVD
jgi:putative glutamine amidotransferase